MGKKGPKKTLNTACWKPTKAEVQKAEWAKHQEMTAKLLETTNGPIYAAWPKAGHVDMNGNSFSEQAIEDWKKQVEKKANFAKTYGASSKTLMSILDPTKDKWDSQEKVFNKLMDEALQKQLAVQISKDIDKEILSGLVGKKVGELKYDELAKQIDKLTQTMAASMKVPPSFLITTQQSLTPTQVEYLKALQKNWGEKMAPLHKDWKKEIIGVDYSNGTNESPVEMLKKTVTELEEEGKSYIPGKSSHKFEFKTLELPKIKTKITNSAAFVENAFNSMDEDAKEAVLNLPTYSELEKLYAANLPDPTTVLEDEEKLKYSLSPDAFTKDTFHQLRQKVQCWWGPKAMTQLAIKRYLTRVIPMCCPYVRDEDVSSAEGLDDYFQAVYHHHFGTQLDTTNEVFEITLSGLTRQEAEEVLKAHGKSKSGKPVFQSTKQLKEIGTNSKAIVSWSFPSSSMAVNGEAILYKTQLNEDGTMSCNCMGWTRGSAKSAEGRFCKHTRAIEDQYSVKLIHTKWKQGAPLGDEFVEVKPGITKAGEAPSTPTYAAKRIVEI
jgi:hypothetical protein